MDLIQSQLAAFTDSIYAFVFFSVPLGFIGAPDLSVPIILIWLVAASVFFTFYLRFMNIRGLKHAFKLIRGDFYDPTATGRITHFQALVTELSGTVGLGNIAGVAIAVAKGGPGAVVWMILAGFFGMSTKFAECTLGVKYRYKDKEGRVHGGPMYYLDKGLKKKGWNQWGKFFGVLFAICCVFATLGAGIAFQVNQSFIQFDNVIGGGTQAWMFGTVFAVIIGAVILGGIKSIANVASKVVPLMAIVYVGTALVVIGMNYTEIPAAFSTIFTSAFNIEAGIGGLVGAFIAGITRAAFSNEAGFGSAAIAHSAVKTKHPATEGFVAMTGPVFDTVIICTITALVIVITGVYQTGDGLGGVEMTSDAFATAFTWFPVVLAICVILFAFSTIISWSYYGCKSINYLFDENIKVETVFKIIACLFVILGAVMDLGTAIKFSEAVMFIMAVPNIIGLYILAPELREDVNKYWKKHAKA